jgi:hypothetical protein
MNTRVHRSNRLPVRALFLSVFIFVHLWLPEQRPVIDVLEDGERSQIKVLRFFVLSLPIQYRCQRCYFRSDVGMVVAECAFTDLN